MVSEQDDTAPPGEGAPATDPKVVSLAAGKAKRAKASASKSPGPPSSEKRDARAKGTGGGGRAKKVDYGKVSYLIKHFALIYGTDTVWDGINRLIMKIANLAHAHGSDVVKIWKADQARRTVMPQDVVFDPTESCNADVCVNLFGGFLLQPREGDVAPFLELGRFLTQRASENSDECDEIFHWLMCWLAYPLQHPGAKLRTAVVMHGDEGAGKNFFFECVLEIYGEYGALVGQDELEDKFNDWRSRKCMVIGDEVATRQELVHQKNRLKALITSPTVMINPKNLPRREERNHINIVFLSNELQPLALDNTDRRYLVVYTPQMRDRVFYEKLKAWRDANGIAALYQYLLSYPLEGFDPYSPAPVTQAKRNLIDLNRKSPERFWLEWASGEIDLPYRTCASSQAYRAYLKYCQRTGDRFPMQRAVFTAMLVRVSESMGRQLDPPRPPVLEWIAKATDPELPGSGKRKATRMLLVKEKPPEKPDGDFATECVEGFEQSLRDYLGVNSSDPPSPEGGTTGSQGGKS
jgi:putative DNA primase/helicase